MMSVFDSPAFDNHEDVRFFCDPVAGLRAIIAIHSTALGPAAGGCRMFPYASEEDAVFDALRLSRGMSFKSALAGVPMGGGKSVIIGDPATEKSQKLFEAFGRAVNTFDGRYHTGEDSGTAVQDMDWASGVSDYIHGTSTEDAGDPSPATSVGIVAGIEAAVRYKLGRDDLEGLVVAIQGVGAVGYGAAEILHQKGARLIVADVNDQAVQDCVEKFGAEAVTTDEIILADAEVFAPCAFGAGINDETLPRFNCDIIAGSANNQLLEDRHGAALVERGILYAPDYVINAGGVIWISDAMENGFDPDRATKRLHAIGDALTAIFQRADQEGRGTNEIADVMAEEIITAAKK
jgi:leucine dehydrogenase